MPMYAAEFSYDIEEYGTVTLEADSLDQADAEVQEHIREAYPDVKNVNVEVLKEI